MAGSIASRATVNRTRCGAGISHIRSAGGATTRTRSSTSDGRTVTTVTEEVKKESREALTRDFRTAVPGVAFRWWTGERPMTARVAPERPAFARPAAECASTRPVFVPTRQPNHAAAEIDLVPRQLQDLVAAPRRVVRKMYLLGGFWPAEPCTVIGNLA